MYLAFAPATSSTPIAIETITDAEPRSGWMMTSTAGAPTIISPPRNRAYDTSSLRSSARYDASISSVVNFAISAGWKLSGPRSKEILSSPDATPSRNSSVSSTSVSP